MSRTLHANDGNGRPLEIKDFGNRSSTGWWAARCAVCKTWLTKHDFSPEDAVELATGTACACAETNGQGVLAV